MDVYEAGKVIGTLEIEPAGLFWNICCKIIRNPERLRRIFLIHGWQVEYCGIPDKNGNLKSKLPQKRLPWGAERVIASTAPKTQWLPWRGEVDGVQVECAWVCRTEEGIDLALPADESLKFPAWAEIMKIETVPEGEMAVIALGPEGQLPVRDIELGGTKDETMDCGDFDFELPAEPASCDGDSFPGDEENGWQAHCPDF